MRGVLVFTLTLAVASAYGPPRPSNNGCGGGGGGGCGGGVQAQPTQIVSTFCGGNGCGGGGGGSHAGGSGGYWWEEKNPFSGPPPSHVSISVPSQGSSQPHSGRPATQPQNPFVQRPQPQQGYVQPRPTQGVSLPQQQSTQNLVQPPMGICPATYVCVHWQLCRDGFIISDGTGNINKQIKNIPGQVASRYQSCGGDMICCGIPAGSRPAPQPQILAPAPTPPRPVIQPPRPAPQPARPAPQPARPAPQPARPAPQPGYSRPSPPQNPLVPQRQPSVTFSQPKPQPTILRPRPPQPQPQPRPPQPQPQSHPQPQRPVSNPIGLVSPPSPQPMPMMMMMGMPMRGGSCSAGTYCVPLNMCNPYNGFIIRDPSQLMAVWPDSPQVPLLPCFVPDGTVNNGVCCQEAHPNAGGFD